MNIKNPNPKTDWKIGDSVFVFTPHDELMSGHITDAVDDTFTVASPFLKLGGLEADELFLSAKDAWDATQTAADQLTEQYKSEINSVIELLQFVLRIPVVPCEEYADDSEIKAYLRAFKEKAEELFGIEL